MILDTTRYLQLVMGRSLLVPAHAIMKQRFEALSSELIKFLDERIPEPYKTTFRRPYPTVWCKLGHFSQAFEINMETKQIFEEFKNINEKATIRSFHLIRYKNRKLPQDKIRVIEQFPLK